MQKDTRNYYTLEHHLKYTQKFKIVGLRNPKSKSTLMNFLRVGSVIRVEREIDKYKSSHMTFIHIKNDFNNSSFPSDLRDISLSEPRDISQFNKLFYIEPIEEKEDDE